MDHPDPEPGGQERTVPATPLMMLGQIAAQPGDVVSSVVMDDEQPAGRAEDSFGLSQFLALDTAER